MSTQKTVVELKDISKSFYLQGGTEIPILHNIDLKVEGGDMIAILGPSGSGKSTLMNIIGGLDIATSGEYYFDGQLVNNMSSDELAELRSTDISFIFQSFHLLPGKTVYQNVMLPLIYQRSFTGDFDEYIRQALTQADLDEQHWHKRPNQLSGGQRQRVAIARALVARPKLLLADEPTGNLDSKTGENIIDSLNVLNEKFGTTIVMVTHDDSLTEVVHRVINIKDGRVFETKGNK
ncbi:MAG: ABC transporter ATP-binding protein [Candidatus Nomurabacteria bacterium]|nr:MAG: ABC transporter ATP-binding protein [Candidatus Nomurabacteria bacterium]